VYFTFFEFTQKEAMNQQQFSNSPENSRNDQPAYNPDPREQRSGQEERSQDYESGYTFSNQGGGKVYPTGRPRRRRSRFRWLWALLLVVLLLGILSRVSHVFSTSTPLAPHTFAVQNEPKLVVTNAAGTVRIHTGESGKIVVTATKHTGLFRNPDDVQVNFTPRGNNELDVTVQSDTGFKFLNAGDVDLDITVPSLADIEDTADAGTLNIDGVSGQMNLHADAGTINVENATLQGSSSIITDAGTINYSGSLKGDGTYNFQADAGTINLDLPSDSAFKLDARSDAGSVNNDFDSTTVGSAPFAQISAHADAGTININKK
jgi:hypothetical protein